MSPEAGTLSVLRGYRVVIVQPPDFEEPTEHLPYRFPRQGPALVAAAVAADGISCRAADIDLGIDRRPLQSAPSLLEDRERLERHLRGEVAEEYVAFGREMIDRIVEFGEIDVDAFAISIDRHTQVWVGLLLGVELKRRFGLPVILGGANALSAARQTMQFGVRGLDLVTIAESPHEIRAAFAALRDLARGRWEVAREPVPEKIPTPPDDWPVPDFSIYDLEGYRRDPFLAAGAERYPGYDGSIGRRLMLPYHFSWDCQYACTFCGRGGTQTVKSVDRAVRDLATLAERYDCADFMLFDAQINLFAEDFARALIGARLGLQWTDSFRVSPRRPPNVLETMARSGCVGLTFGVESVSDRMLKRMVKGHTAAQASSAVKDAHALQMFVRANLLPCFPGERREDQEITMRWVAEHAHCIDEVVPSSFYLAANSPVLALTERYEIVVRERRTMQGDYKYRKNFGSLAFDEIGGYSWEEREAMLRPAEDELRETWASARTGTPSLTQPSQVFGLRHAYATKAECYAAVARWEEAPVVEVETRSGAEAVCEPDSPEVAATPLPPPAGSQRAGALDAIAMLVTRLRLTPTLLAGDASQLAIRLADARGAALALFLERVRSDGRYFRRAGSLGVWYRRDDATGPPNPRWLSPVLDAVAKLLLSPAFAGIGDELSEQAPPSPSRAAAPCREAAPHVSRPVFPRYTVFDLVRRGLKPAAALSVDSEEAARRLAEGLPATALSRFRFVRDGRDNLVAVADADATPAATTVLSQRMVYVGRSQSVVDRLRDIEEALYVRRDPPAAETEALHEELGIALGFPACCARRFARTSSDYGGHADFYGSLAQLGWHLRPIAWRLNHVVARLYSLPFLIHVPCRADCRATLDLVESVTSRLYDEAERLLVESVLSQGALVFPDDRFVLFRPLGLPNAAGELQVEEFNSEEYPQVLGSPRAPERCVGRDAGEGCADAEIECVRVGDGRGEVFARGVWRAYAPAEAAHEAAPILLAPAPRDGNSVVAAAGIARRASA